MKKTLNIGGIIMENKNKELESGYICECGEKVECTQEEWDNQIEKECPVDGCNTTTVLDPASFDWVEAE